MIQGLIQNPRELISLHVLASLVQLHVYFVGFETIIDGIYSSYDVATYLSLHIHNKWTSSYVATYISV